MNDAKLRAWWWQRQSLDGSLDGKPPAGDFNNLQWVTRLDVIFAELYFAALHGFLTHAGPTPSSWQAIFEARHKPHIERIQFAALGGATRIKPGTVLPAPVGIFPRYIEPTAA